MAALCSVHDVAAYILRECGDMSAMKLQKLVYYAQAWSLVWDERPLFDEQVQAWANGPVVYELYDKHRGRFTVSSWEWGNAECLDEAARQTVDAVIEAYSRKPAQWLSDLTHAEAPWRDARGDRPAGEPSSAEITHAAMAEYYGSLDADAQLV